MNPRGLVLGISTVGPVEVALACAGLEVVAASNKGALESLTELLASALAQAGRRIEDVRLIGVCTGPGSFTGLRIGVAFAKSLAQSSGVPIVGISAYDVASFHIDALPVICVARGKQDHYYARILERHDGEPRFIQGGRDVIEQAAAEIGTAGVPAAIVGPDFSECTPGEAARTVAQLGQRAFELGAELHWTNIAIDYGQRPNAVANWEKRHVAKQEGPPLSRRELPTE